MRYSRSSDGVYVRAGHAQSIDYSDGDSVEGAILEIVRAADDLSSLSEELHAAAFDWPSEYHLSRQRHVLVRPIGIQPGDRILELGAGCGAITRYLGELGAEVDAVEGALSRTKIAASRTRDLSNVRVFCDDFMDFEPDEKYDWVLLIGVLEYSPVFIVADDPVVAALNRAIAHLSERGRLVVAIENRMGLKYLNGANEDHLGIPFVGVEQRYGRRQPQTFSRTELLSLLEGVGLTRSTVLLPFPDYKLPSTIVHVEAAERGVRVAEALLMMNSNDYGIGRPSSFNERMVRRSVADSSLLAELSDSFLVISGPESGGSVATDGLFWHYSLGTRKSILACETRISCARDPIADLRVFKRRLSGASHEVEFAAGRFLHRSSESEFARGSSVASLFVDALIAPGMADMSLCVQGAVDEYVRCLSQLTGRAIARSASDARQEVDGSFLDCIPRNIIVSRSEHQFPTFIDQEWAAAGTVPLSRLLFRAALDLQHAAQAVFESSELDSAIRDAFRPFGLDDVLWCEHLREEQIFQKSLAPDPPVYTGQYSQRTPLAAMLIDLRAERDRLVAERDWWNEQFHRLRQRRTVRFALQVARVVGRWRARAK